MARAEETWRRALVAHLGKHKRYPQAAREKGTAGTATVRFVVDRGGRVVERAVVESSGSPILAVAVIAPRRCRLCLPICVAKNWSSPHGAIGQKASITPLKRNGVASPPS